MEGGAGREGRGHGPLQRAPAAHRRAEGLLLPGGLALRRRAAAGTGAIDDSRRIAEFIYRNLGVAHRRHDDDGHPLRVPDLLPVLLARPGRPAAHRRYREITREQIERGRGAAEPGRGQVAVRRQLPLAAQAGAALLRGARARRQVQALPVAAALPARQRRPRARRRRPRGAPVPRVRPRRAVVGRGQGRQPAHRELLGAAARGADRATTGSRSRSATRSSSRRCSPPTRWSSRARRRATA